MEVVIENQHTGILAGHAYSILDAFEIPKPRGKKPRKTSRLLRIRNPWHRKEWNGKWADDSPELIENEERIREVLNKKYEGTSEKISVNEEDGCFFMCFSDFRRIYNKIFVCVNYPPNYVGIRYHASWNELETGGLPINNRPEEIRDFANNPQFYFSREKDGMVHISLLQNDGRLTGTKFPFANTVRKACLLLFKANGKKRITNLNNLLDKTLIVQRRDLSLEMKLPRGEYIIVPSTLTKGEKGEFSIEIYAEDKINKGSNKSDGQFDIKRLSYTYLEKLGGQPGKLELANIDTQEKYDEATENKKNFMYSIFQKKLQDGEGGESYYIGNRGPKTGGATKGNDDSGDDYDDDYSDF